MKIYFSFIKLRINDISAYLLIPLSELILRVCRKNKNDYFEIWLICTSKFQFDIGTTLINRIHKVDIRSKYNFKKNKNEIIYIKISKQNNKSLFLVKDGMLKELNKNFLFLKTRIPNKVYLSSVSPMLFNSNLLYSIFLLLRLKRFIRFIDDGLSGNLGLNRHYINNYCPKSDLIYSWDFKNYFKKKQDKNNKKISFNKLFNIINNEKIYEDKIPNNKKSILIISSKYIDYNLIKNKLRLNNNFDKNYIYIPHPRKWKNNSYFMKNCEIINPICIESWIMNNKDLIEDIYLGVSATTLIISELFLINKIKAKITLCLQSELNSNYCEKELLCFIDNAINSRSFKEIYSNGKLIL